MLEGLIRVPAAVVKTKPWSVVVCEDLHLPWLSLQVPLESVRDDPREADGVAALLRLWLSESEALAIVDAREGTLFTYSCLFPGYEALASLWRVSSTFMPESRSRFSPRIFRFACSVSCG